MIHSKNAQQLIHSNVHDGLYFLFIVDFEHEKYNYYRGKKVILLFLPAPTFFPDTFGGGEKSNRCR